MENVMNMLNGLNVDGSSLASIDMGAVDDDERIYHESDFDHFQYVFTKDNMSTYHQQFDNILHWIWNEYSNDPAIYESLEYKTKICDKVFTTINARILGVLNPDDNHATILSILDNMVPDVNMFEYVAKVREKLYDRKSSFTEDDAIVWYKIGKPSISKDAMFAVKELPIPYIRIGDTIIQMDDHLQDFYLAIFRYAIRWYNHLYSSKNESLWHPINENGLVFAVPSKKTINDNFKYLHPDDDVSDIISLKNLHSIKWFNLKIGDVIVLNISSENGQFHDKVMSPFCFAYLARREDGYWISSQRGYDLWELVDKYDLNNSHWEKHWINTLTARNKNEEAILSEMWRDIMQCNAVLFPQDNRISINIKLRIIHWDQYFRIPLILNFDDRIVSVDNNIAVLSISNLSTLLKIWSLMEHTLDLWIAFSGEKISWSLISNIYKNKYQMYIDKPHITKQNASDDIVFEPGDDVVAIVPRDGMSWFVSETQHTFVPKPINDLEVRKSYL